VKSCMHCQPLPGIREGMGRKKQGMSPQHEGEGLKATYRQEDRVRCQGYLPGREGKGGPLQGSTGMKGLTGIGHRGGEGLWQGHQAGIPRKQQGDRRPFPGTQARCVECEEKGQEVKCLLQLSTTPVRSAA